MDENSINRKGLHLCTFKTPPSGAVMSERGDADCAFLMRNGLNEIFIASWDHSKWLTLSSFCFMFPAFYAYNKHMYFYSTLLLLTSLVSANYWRKATYSWRRNLDLVFAKISFIIFVSNGIMYVRKIRYIITGYTGLLVLLYCYYLSGKLLETKNDHWYKYHILFHIIMMYEQFIILNSIPK